MIPRSTTLIAIYFHTAGEAGMLVTTSVDASFSVTRWTDGTDDLAVIRWNGLLFDGEIIPETASTE